MSQSQHHLGHYELLQSLGSGPMSEVWKAYDTQQHRYVAIKILQINPQAAADLIPRFERETQNLTSLQHSNIAQVFEAHASYTPGATDNKAYLVMDYVEGLSLADYIQTTSHAGNFPSPVDIVRLLAPIGSAIDYMHQQGIIHGRIKPSNIRLAKYTTLENPLSEPVLIGFGMHTMQPPLTLSLEDAYYLSPEQAQGNTENKRSDIYALGVILYELCTGTLPFQGDQVADVLLQHINAMPTAPTLINPRILPALTAVLIRGLAKDPVARFSTASALVTALARAFNLSLQDSVSQSGSVLRRINPLSGDQWEVMNSPTYLSPLPHYLSQPPENATSSLANSWSALASPSQSGQGGPGKPDTPSEALAMMLQSDPRSRSGLDAPNTPSMFNHPPTALIPLPASRLPVPAQAPPVSVSPSTIRGKKGRSKWLLALIVILVIVLLGSGLAAFQVITNGFPGQKSIAGQAFFVSSGILNQSSNQGIADALQLDLQNLPDPHAGSSYYAWLLNDNDANTNALPILLGTLAVKNGHANISYPGDALHSDLLAQYSRLLVTEESTSPPPTNPSLDTTTWRYYAAFPRTPNPADTINHFSVLDHLRHLLAEDPKLKGVGLTGGLDIWLFRNTTKVLEWSGSARDAYNAQDTGLMRRQLVRILDYLDGSQFISNENIPPDLVSVENDPAIAHVARVALLQSSPTQQPPGYLRHIGTHLLEITESPGVTPDQQRLARQISDATSNVQAWLTAVQKDAQTLLRMTPEQLKQPGVQTILNDLFTQANAAFVGQTDPNTNQVREGVAQIHYNIQRLATFTITPCTSGNTSNPCV